ncbi:hypothetical protein A33M_2050 [Rhodovulum sp. PH10]|nr:hypothetical protein A33M_2050 [Rhodovulum sp. PH10]
MPRAVACRRWPAEWRSQRVVSGPEWATVSGAVSTATSVRHRAFGLSVTCFRPGAFARSGSPHDHRARGSAGGRTRLPVPHRDRGHPRTGSPAKRNPADREAARPRSSRLGWTAHARALVEPGRRSRPAVARPARPVR